MLEHFTTDDTKLHKQIRLQSQKIVNTTDDRNFITTEIKNAVDSLNNKKAPTENGITGQIFKQTFQNLPTYTATTYKECCESEL
jgi:hypothetical protein